MGHLVNAGREYRLLQQRLDQHVLGAPESPAFTKILEILFSPEEARLARKLPFRPAPLDELSATLGVPEDELTDKVADMARRGLLIDLEYRGRRYAALPPVAFGFYELVLMRTRDDVPLAEISRLFEQYMQDGSGLLQAVFGGNTQVARTLVREEALPQDDHVEVFDWERASRIVETASAIGVSLCVCRHKASHLGKACDRPQRCCLSFNYAAEALIHSGNAERITAGEAMRILEECKRAGLAQIGENVKRTVAFLCNCCGCCCGMFEAVRDFDIRNAIMTSNWIVQIDPAKCKGCGACAKTCPVGAIEITEQNGTEPKRKLAIRDETLCLGCGVCYSACKTGGISMKPRPQRVFTPEAVFDRLVLMAIERGKLAELIFDSPEKLSHRALGRILHVLERTSLFKAVVAIAPLRSVFLRALVHGAKKRTGPVGEAAT